MYYVLVSNGLYKLWGRNMGRYRDAAQMTRKEVASKLGVSVPTVSRWENGLVMPDDEKKIEIAELYGVQARRLFPLDGARS